MQFCCWSIDHDLPNRREYQTYTATVEKWVEILALAQKWEFKEVEKLCIRELEKLPIPPVEKIRIYEASHLDRSLLAESFEEITLRPKPLALEEAGKLRLEMAIRIAVARERARGFNPISGLFPTQVSDSELRSVIREVFGVKQTTGVFGR